MQRKRLSFLMGALVPVLGACASSASEEPYESPPPAATAGDEVSPPAAQPEPGRVAAPAPEQTEPEPAAKPPEPPPPPTPTAGAVLQFKVKDYAAWKAAFDEAESTRAQAGVLGHGISLQADSDDNVVLYLAALDADALKAFVQSKEFKSTMKQAGAKGPLKPTLMTHGESNPAQDSTAAAMITYTVKDFDAWKQDFDAREEQRQEAGIAGYGISQDPKKPNLVHVYLEAENVETLQEFTKSEEFKTATKEAGVKGKPKVTLVTVEEMKFYPPQPKQAPSPAMASEESAPAETP